jgi:hypothetical protein
MLWLMRFMSEIPREPERKLQENANKIKYQLRREE